MTTPPSGGPDRIQARPAVGAARSGGIGKRNASDVKPVLGRALLWRGPLVSFRLLLEIEKRVLESG